MRDELIPFFFAHLLLQVGEKRVAFFIRDTRESIVRVFPFKVDY